MKVFIIASLLACFAVTGYSQGVPSSCTAPDSIVNLFAEDAARITLDLMIERNPTYTDSTNIPQALQDTFLRTLIAVYNSGLRATDTIMGRVNLYSQYYSDIRGPIFIHARFLKDYSSFSLKKNHLEHRYYYSLEKLFSKKNNSYREW